MGINTIKEGQSICEKAVALRQYIEEAPGADLPKWAVDAGIEHKMRKGILCFNTEKNSKEGTDTILNLWQVECR